MRRRNSFKRGLLSASFSVTHFPLYHFARTRMAARRARSYKCAEGSNCCEMLENASKFHMNYLISVMCQSVAELVLSRPSSRCTSHWLETRPWRIRVLACIQLRSERALRAVSLDVLQQAPACRAKRRASVCAISQAARVEHIPQAVRPAAHASKHSAYLI